MRLVPRVEAEVDEEVAVGMLAGEALGHPLLDVLTLGHRVLAPGMFEAPIGLNRSEMDQSARSGMHLKGNSETALGQLSQMGTGGTPGQSC